MIGRETFANCEMSSNVRPLLREVTLWILTFRSRWSRRLHGSRLRNRRRSQREFLTEPEIQRRERENLWIVLQKTGWKIKGADGAAELLGIKPTTLISRIKKMGLKRQGA